MYVCLIVHNIDFVHARVGSKRRFFLNQPLVLGVHVRVHGACTAGESAGRQRFPSFLLSVVLASELEKGHIFVPDNVQVNVQVYVRTYVLGRTDSSTLILLSHKLHRTQAHKCWGANPV
jgi:hypothetical protein